MEIRNNLVRALAGSALGLTVAAAGIATAGPASAASLPRACRYVHPHPVKHVTSTAVNLRTGPGTTYVSKGILSKGTRFSEYCTNGKRNWSYGKVTSGPNKGKTGWVRGIYLRWVIG
ncbi:SH3 domain-containing protein [Streptomyces sp. YIM S03343]